MWPDWRVKSGVRLSPHLRSYTNKLARKQGRQEARSWELGAGNERWLRRSRLAPSADALFQPTEPPFHCCSSFRRSLFSFPASHTYSIRMNSPKEEKRKDKEKKKIAYVASYNVTSGRMGGHATSDQAKLLATQDRHPPTVHAIAFACLSQPLAVLDVHQYVRHSTCIRISLTLHD